MPTEPADLKKLCEEMLALAEADRVTVTPIEKAELLHAVKQLGAGPGVDVLRRILREHDALLEIHTALPTLARELLSRLEAEAGAIRTIREMHDAIAKKEVAVDHAGRILAEHDSLTRPERRHG